MYSYTGLQDLLFDLQAPLYIMILLWLPISLTKQPKITLAKTFWNTKKESGMNWFVQI